MKLPNLENWSTGEQTKIKSDSKVDVIKKCDPKFVK